MSPTKVGIIGCGISGPVLAILLKLRGYDTIIYERHEASIDAGLAVGLQRNGLLVLSAVPGLLHHIGGHAINEIQFYSTVDEDKGLLGVTDYPSASGGKENLGMRMLERSDLQLKLVSFAETAGVEIKWGHKLTSLKQDAESVTATFSNGVKEVFSFVVGCDGLHSQTRTCLFSEQRADYTGLSMWGGISPLPEAYHDAHVVKDIYGNGAHGLFVPVGNSKIAWGKREPEARESWKSIDNVTAQQFKRSPFALWEFGAGDIIKASTKIVKFGVYLRPELSNWHDGRIVLIGDAAHPFSPHVGQGANQALEDAHLLFQLLDKYNPNARPPTTPVLDQIFLELSKTRTPRISDMITRAQLQGDARTVQGLEACIARNNNIREKCQTGSIAAARLGA